MNICVKLLEENNWDIEGDSSITIMRFSSYTGIKEGSVVFFKNFDPDILVRRCLLVVSEDSIIPEEILKYNAVIRSQNPRLEFAKLADYISSLIPNEDREYRQNDGYTVGEGVLIGENCKIFPGVFIDHEVSIGSNSTLFPHSVILNNVTIGKNCQIGAHSCIGQAGFGFERDHDGQSYRLPHVGGVIMGDNVEIGMLNTVASGTLSPTILESNVKTDDHVHIAHNCYVGSGSYIIAGAVLSGSVKIGCNNWISPNSTIINKTETGDNVTVGIGAVVLKKKIVSGATLSGNPAVPINQILEEKRLLKKIERFFKKRSDHL